MQPEQNLNHRTEFALVYCDITALSSCYRSPACKQVYHIHNHPPQQLQLTGPNKILSTQAWSHSCFQLRLCFQFQVLSSALFTILFIRICESPNMWHSDLPVSVGNIMMTCLTLSTSRMGGMLNQCLQRHKTTLLGKELRGGNVGNGHI